jgi:hypothetical protein
MTAQAADFRKKRFDMDDSNSGFWTVPAFAHTLVDKEDTIASAPAYLPIHIKSPFASVVFRVFTYFWFPMKGAIGACARNWCQFRPWMVHRRVDFPSE